MRFGSVNPAGAKVLQVIGRCRCNILISGGTGSGKTTLLNSLTAFIDADERIITCEDAAELATAAAPCGAPRNPAAEP